jgi:hypothetical protein
MWAIVIYLFLKKHALGHEKGMIFCNTSRPLSFNMVPMQVLVHLGLSSNNENGLLYKVRQ